MTWFSILTFLEFAFKDFLTHESAGADEILDQVEGRGEQCELGQVFQPDAGPAKPPQCQLVFLGSDEVEQKGNRWS